MEDETCADIEEKEWNNILDKGDMEKFMEEHYDNLDDMPFVKSIRKEERDKIFDYLIEHHEDLCCVKGCDDYEGCGYAKKRLIELKKKWSKKHGKEKI